MGWHVACIGGDDKRVIKLVGKYERKSPISYLGVHEDNIKMDVVERGLDQSGSE
jgi:hypothetical protein